MVELAGRHPGYGWELNKGYASPEHLAALRELGPCPAHRRSWSLPGVGDVAGADEVAGSEGDGVDLRDLADLADLAEGA
jgi:ribonuclease HII